MMRKYKVTVSKYINCSSSGDYFGTVMIYETDPKSNKRDTRHLDFNGMGLFYHTGMGHYQGYPKYVDEQIITQLFSMLENNELVVFEYDRDRNERTENLRYHEPEQLRHEITLYFDKIMGLK